MSGFLLIAFETAGEVERAAEEARAAGHPAQDALCHKPVEGLVHYLRPPPGKKPIGWVMMVSAILGAVGGYFLQWYSAVISYQIHSGGRPLNSWPAFLLVPYEAAILSAAIVGLLSWMGFCGLPSLYHPLFAAEIVERASQDRFVLVFADEPRTRAWLERHWRGRLERVP